MSVKLENLSKLQANIDELVTLIKEKSFSLYSHIETLPEFLIKDNFQDRYRFDLSFLFQRLLVSGIYVKLILENENFIFAISQPTDTRMLYAVYVENQTFENNMIEVPMIYSDGRYLIQPEGRLTKAAKN